MTRQLRLLLLKFIHALIALHVTTRPLLLLDHVGGGAVEGDLDGGQRVGALVGHGLRELEIRQCGQVVISASTVNSRVELRAQRRRVDRRLGTTLCGAHDPVRS